jgi:hypothetical protein|tara:strand:+ start:2424 stop:2744 length:321 start_codon:yes stop_codon:yes gene_type:complete
MIQNKSLIYGLVIISGIILVWLVYADQGIQPKPDIFSEETPLILVDGKIPPKLSRLPAHLQFIDEQTCMQCHTTERKMNFGSGPVIAKKMPHEFRENCASCHILEK